MDRKGKSGAEVPAETAKSAGKARAKEQSQLMELFIHVAESLGLASDRDLAELGDATVENVVNWRTGAVQEFKAQKLKTIKTNLAEHIERLKAQTGATDRATDLRISPIEIEEGSSPTDLQRQFRDSVSYDYLGHRFLYFEAMGALAWENLIKRGYDQDRWVTATEDCARAWLDPRREGDQTAKGPIADALGITRKAVKRGLDVVSLGPGEGSKEVAVLGRIIDALKKSDERLGWLSYVPVDVSIPLLLEAATGARRLFGEVGSSLRTRLQVRSFCADFEEGRLLFKDRLPTALQPDLSALRLILMLGNTFGNLRDEERFVRQRLWPLTRTGDLVWLEVGLRLHPIESDPLFRMTMDGDQTATDANRRLLLEGPFRRYEAATGRAPAALDLKVWLREDDDSTHVPGSANFCHDLVLRDERRACTMLYSRRYDIEKLAAWLEALDFEVLRLQRVEDEKKRARVGHLLLRRR